MSDTHNCGRLLGAHILHEPPGTNIGGLEPFGPMKSAPMSVLQYYGLSQVSAVIQRALVQAIFPISFMWHARCIVYDTEAWRGRIVGDTTCNTHAVQKRTIACPSTTARCITFETLAASLYLRSLHAVSDKIQNNNSLITVIFANQTAALCSDSWNMIVL